ncbi:autorepressor SdpR family transcription factor [Dubosiella muris]|uniref:ArsR family transcriptional regulator n=1 Tax=Dubosiella muris TaxID=3038133 RepID=A0AC61R777_9FIRM|nr:autorepressor SdpR family transcription factor [Dubosiella muris]TGY66019.1 ArsR family transcriptional regulator [Dubosiella muris]
MALDQTLKALDDPIRRSILNLLKQRSMTVQEIVEHFSISQPAISRHLSVLKKADLIRDERHGKYIVYTLNTSVLEEVILWMQDLKGERYERQVVSKRTSR